MAWVPLVVGVLGARSMSGGGLRRFDVPSAAHALPGPGQPARGAGSATAAGRTTPAGPAPAARPAPPAAAMADPETTALRDIASLMGAAITEAAAETPMDPRLRSATADVDAGFSEGTQALLDRLERLADMRDRGLLGEDEFETAKTAIVRELESRT